MMFLLHHFAYLNASKSKICFHSKMEFTGVYLPRNQVSFQSSTMLLTDSETSEMGRSFKNTKNRRKAQYGLNR